MIDDAPYLVDAVAVVVVLGSPRRMMMSQHLDYDSVDFVDGDMGDSKQKDFDHPFPSVVCSLVVVVVVGWILVVAVVVFDYAPKRWSTLKSVITLKRQLRRDQRWRESD